MPLSNIQPPGVHWWRRLVEEGGSWRRSPKAKNAGRDALVPWNGNYGRLRLNKMAVRERPFLFPLCAFTSLRKDSRVLQAHQGYPTPPQRSTLEEWEVTSLPKTQQQPQTSVPQGGASCTSLTSKQHGSPDSPQDGRRKMCVTPWPEAHQQLSVTPAIIKLQINPGA